MIGEGMFYKAHPVPSFAMGRATFLSLRPLQAPSNLIWDTSRDGEWSYPGAGPGRISTSTLYIPPPPSPCLSSAASLPAAPGASLNSSQLHIASGAPLLQQIPLGHGKAHTPSSSPREIPNIPAGSMGVFFPAIPGSSRKDQRLTVGGGARPPPGWGFPVFPRGAGKRSPGIRNGRGRPGRAVPRSLVQLTAAAAFKFCSSCGGRKQEAPELLARASRAHPRPRTRLRRLTLGMALFPHPAETRSIPTPMSRQGVAGDARSHVASHFSSYS